MKLSDKAIKEFVEIYKDEFGIVLTENQAFESAMRFLLMFKAISSISSININTNAKQNKDTKIRK